MERESKQHSSHHADDSLRDKLSSLGDRGYGAYQTLKGSYAFPDFKLCIDLIPKDPFAPPGTGVFRVSVVLEKAGFPADMFASSVRKIALRDFLARQFEINCQKFCPGNRGTGYSGIIAITIPEQVILERSSVVISQQALEVRFFIGLPAQGRTINHKLAQKMLFEELPQIVQHTLYAEQLDPQEIYNHLHTAEDADALREMLRSKGLVAFIRNGAVLPRESGISQRPLTSTNVIPFRSPQNLELEFELPNAGLVRGMGIKQGVTLIVGGGYHGKSTLLQALEQGIYNHIPGDGREYCVALSGATKIRASNGRYVEKTDISDFIENIPYKNQTTDFSTENASGSTSQAANIIEAMEVGAEVLLMDEDTSAANFMARDTRMQQLVVKEKEPITTFVDRVQQLYKEKGVSTILVMGSCGDYFDVADQVIQMTEFVPDDVTRKAHEIAKNYPTKRVYEGGKAFRTLSPRVPTAQSLDPCTRRGKIKIGAPECNKLFFGQSTVDLTDVEQIVEKAQTKTIGRALLYLQGSMGEAKSLAELIAQVNEQIRTKGIDILDDRLTGDMANCRGIEIAAALNRLRGMKVKSEAEN